MNWRTAAALAIAVVGLCVASCSSGKIGGHDGGQAAVSIAPPSPHIAATVKPAPSQDPEGGKLVLFDPCQSIGDDVISRIGFDPSTRERDDDVHTGYAFIACRFSRHEIKDEKKQLTGILHISSTNITIDQFRQREGDNFSSVTVNGSAAISFASPKAESCDIVTRGPDNSLDIAVAIFGVPEKQVCDQAQEIGGVIDAVVNGRK